MKKVTTILLLLIGAINLKAQDIIPLVVEGKQWNVLYSMEGPSPTLPHRKTTSYSISGDTVLDGTSYKKLFGTIHEDLSNWQLQGALRENADGQVFFRAYKSNHTFENQESLLYDFSMQMGDSIYYYDNPTSCLKLLRVNDTILEGENTPRKKYVFRMEENGHPTIHGNETWIEGIGSEFGLLFPGSRFLVGGTYDLLCYYEDDDLIWQNPNFNSCYLSTDGVEESEAGVSLSVHPNPAKDLVRIEGLESSEVQIYNTLGQLVSVNHNTNEISVRDLPKGIYLLRITDVNGSSFTSRIVVAN